MSPFRCTLRLVALQVALIAPAASAQTITLDEPATAGGLQLEPRPRPETPEARPNEPGGAGAAPGPLTLPPQESRGLGEPVGLLSLPDDRSRASAGAPARRLEPRVGEIARVGSALAAVIGLLLLLRLGLRRLGGPLAGGGRPAGVLEVLARYPIARAQQIVLLKLCGRIVLLHQTRTGLTPLSEVSDPNEVAALLARVESGGRDGAGGFPSLLDRLLARRRAPHDEFARALGRKSELEEKVVVDLTRRPRRRRAARGGAR
jgi:flagellar biogenesis protein FliO